MKRQVQPAKRAKRVRLTDYERHLRDMEFALMYLFAPAKCRGRAEVYLKRALGAK